MTQQEFVDSIKNALINKGTEVILDAISEPYDKPPSKSLLERQFWFNSLDEKGKEMVIDIINTSLDMTVYRFLTLLDHNWFIEDGPNKGKFKLYYENKNKTDMVFLNDPNEDELHTLL
jgi:hypothetical protein